MLDDEHDFFAVDATSWASAEEKEALEKRERELRELKYGRKIIEDRSEIGEMNFYDYQSLQTAIPPWFQTSIEVVVIFFAAITDCTLYNSSYGIV